MKTSELKTQIEGYLQDGSLKDQTVEVVIGTKKYFIAGSEKNTDSLTFNVTRKNYTSMSNSNFLKKITEAHADANCQFNNLDAGGEPLGITTIHLSPNFLEVSTDE